VAVTGVIFFGAVHHGHGYAPAFTTSVAELAGLLVLVLVLMFRPSGLFASTSVRQV
jgi:branched-subunit amino acid ABC-type transport system permease component